MSWPHFLHGDPALLQGVHGLNPDESEHSFIFNIEPVSSGVEYVITGSDFKMSPVFPTLTVAKPLVTEGTSGCQMKDMDLIFPLIPYGLL